MSHLASYFSNLERGMTLEMVVYFSPDISSETCCIGSKALMAKLMMSKVSLPTIR